MVKKKQIVLMIENPVVIETGKEISHYTVTRLKFKSIEVKEYDANSTKDKRVRKRAT